MAEERVVVLRGKPEQDEQNEAAEPITPGMLIELDANDEWIASGAGHRGAIFALERDELGDGIDVDYAAGDRVKAGYFRNGDRVNALIASGESVAAGDSMHAAAGGLLTTGADNAARIGIAVEDVTATEGQARLAVAVVK